MAYDEAGAYYGQALEVLEVADLPDGEARHLDLLIALGEAQRRAGDSGHRETLLHAARLAQANAGEVLKALGSEDSGAQLEMVKLAGRLKLPGAPDGMEPLLASGDRGLKLAVVEALTAIASPAALRLLERAIDDSDRDVRIAGVRFLASRGYRNAAARVEAIVSGSKLRNADLTEKMAFFEAYGTLVGAKGIPALDKLLVAKGLLGKREDPETRACAAMALGKVRTPEARAVLERAAQDKEPLVRNAVARALREVGA